MSETTFLHVNVGELEMLTNPANQDLRESYLDSLVLIHDKLCASSVSSERPWFDTTERTEHFSEVRDQFENRMQTSSIVAALYSKMTHNWNEASGNADDAGLPAWLLNAVVWEFKVVSDMRMDDQSQRS